jgi:hypothetical protein
MKPATLVTLTGRPAVVTDAVSSPSFGMSRVGANASHHLTRVVAHPPVTNFEGERPAPTPTQKSRITGDEDTL